MQKGRHSLFSYITVGPSFSSRTWQENSITDIFPPSEGLEKSYTIKFLVISIEISEDCICLAVSFYFGIYILHKWKFFFIWLRVTLASEKRTKY